MKIELARTDRASWTTVWQNNTKSFVAAPERKDDLNRSRMSDLNEKIRGCLRVQPGNPDFNRTRTEMGTVKDALKVGIKI